MIDLITIQELKDSGLIDKNVLDSYLLPAIQLSQDQGLQFILGSTLYKQLRNEDVVDEELMTYIKPYLLYKTVAELQIILNYKQRNAGTVYANDVNYGTIPVETIQHLAKYYDDKAQFYANQLTKYLNSTTYLKKDDLKDPNHLNSGVWLKHKRQIVGTKENIEALLKKIQLLEAEVEMFKESVEPLQAEVLQLRTENNQLRTTINNLNNTIAQKESIIISQQQTIANLSSLDIDDIIDKLDNIDTKVVGVGTKVNTIDSNINNGFTLTNSNISNLGADIDNIDTLVTTIDNKVALQGTDNTATNTATYERIGDVEDIINHLNNIQL